MNYVMNLKHIAFFFSIRFYREHAQSDFGVMVRHKTIKKRIRKIKNIS